MAIWGVDYSEGLNIQVLVQYNAKFACRYVGYTSPGLPQTKILTHAEAVQLSAAGIAIVSNWEWYASRPSEGFDAGVWDAQQADAAHRACGGPSNCPIYFSVDYNTDGRETVGYFQGVASVIGLSRVGVYGSYACVNFLKGANLVTWVWQTYAWSGNAFYSGNHIYQYSNGVLLGSMVVDYDNAYYSNFGQWTLGGNKFMDQQFNDVWNAFPGAYASGIYQIAKQAFLAHKMSACGPVMKETNTVDWAGNPVVWQTFSNGFYCTYAGGGGTVYNPTNGAVYSGKIAPATAAVAEEATA